MVEIKGTFGETLRIVIMLVFALLALIVIWNIMEKIFGFSAGLLWGAMKSGYCKATGGSAGTGALIGGGVAAGLCGAGLALGFLSFGTTALLSCGLGVALGSGSGAAVTSGVC